jgi:hypothetical protein
MMDFIGMLGIPLIPVSAYPRNAKTIFLPTQAASDPEVCSKVESSLEKGARIIMTAGFLAKINDDGDLAQKAGISVPIAESLTADRVLVDGIETSLSQPLDLESTFDILEAEPVLEAKVGGKLIPFLTKSADGQIYVLNSHTFSEEDFEAVGEVLLCPRPLGIVELPQSWANSIRNIFNHELEVNIEAPTRVTMQPLQSGQVVLHNYNKSDIELIIHGIKEGIHIDQFTNQELSAQDGQMKISMPPRSRVWIVD